MKKTNLFLEINSFKFYINNKKYAPDKNLYYKSNSDSYITKSYSPKLVIRYINKKTKFKYN
jgi:hypothetical protein